MSREKLGPLSAETLDKLKAKKLLPDDIINSFSNLGMGGGGTPTEFGSSKEPSAIDKALNMIKPSEQSQQPGFMNKVGEGLSQLFGFSPREEYGSNATEFGTNNSGAAKTDSPSVEQVAPQDLALQAQPAPTQQDMMKSLGEQSTAGVLRGYDIQQNAILQGANAGAKQAAAESAYLNTMNADLEKRRADDAVREQERQAKMQGELTKLDEAVNKFATMPKTSREVFDRMGTGQKILSGIALFLGAAPNSTGQNKAVAVMDASLNQAIEAQKADINNRETFLGKMRNTFADDRQAEAATRLAYINDAQLKLNQIASQYKGPQIEANAKNLYGQLEAAKQKEIQNFSKASMLNPMAQHADLMTKQILALPKEMQGKALEEKGILEGIESAKKNIMSQVETIANTSYMKSKIPYTEARAAVQAAKSGIMTSIQANWKGPMSDSDLARIDGLLPTEGDTKEQAVARGKSLVKVLETNAKPTPILKGFGIKPVAFEDKYRNLKPL